MNNVIVGLIVVILVVVGGWWFLADRGDVVTETNQQATSTDRSATVTPPPSQSTSTGGTTSGAASPAPAPAGTPASAQVKSFTVHGSNFKFSPAEMRVKQGDRVRVTFVNDSGRHDWRLDAFRTGTAVLAAGASETVEFTADRKGTFEYYCSVGEHRTMGMVGNLIVE